MYYKVVRTFHGRMFSHSTTNLNRYFSNIVFDHPDTILREWSKDKKTVEYIIGKKTEPKIEGSALFAFLTLEQAKENILENRMFNSGLILVGEGQLYSGDIGLCHIWDPNIRVKDVEYAWKKPDKRLSKRFELPEGTTFLRNFTPKYIM